MSLTYTDRVGYTQNPTAQHLLKLMDVKKTNLCVAADVVTKFELLALADTLGPEICIFKTHIDIVEDFDDDLIIQLQRLAEKHNFMMFEDRKFADIGKTVQIQYQDGIYHIADWAYITNTHTVAGPGSIAALKEVGLHKGRGLLLLAEMTPAGTLAQGDYTKESIKMAEKNSDFVIGFITTRKLVDDPGFIHMTPGVKLHGGGDKHGQRYNTPASVIEEKKCDVIIVGRGVTQADDMLEAAKIYRAAGWDAYQKRLIKNSH